jgi:hypothetical protein
MPGGCGRDGGRGSLPQVPRGGAARELHGHNPPHAVGTARDTQDRNPRVRALYRLRAAICRGRAARDDPAAVDESEPIDSTQRPI